VVADGSMVGSTAGLSGDAGDLPTGTPGPATVGSDALRVQAVDLPVTSGTAQVVSSFPQAELDRRISDAWLRIGGVLLIAIVVLGILALIVAERISRSVTDLAERASAIVEASGEEPPQEADELEQLGTALDTMSSELNSRMEELESERTRLKSTMARYGETLAATHDMNALIDAVLQMAVQATRARGGRLLQYDPDRGEAVEQARIGTARGSRSDLPMVVHAGAGLEGEVLTELEPVQTGQPRAMLSTPIVREDRLLGIVTVVDPEDGFRPDDVETLSGLAVQAGIAIENARLHGVVERQAVTDDLTGLANRRQFFDVYGREFERCQRFGYALSLILLDLDDFKMVNDTHPLKHLAGDAVLRSVASTIAGLIRDIDLAARYGGEEFAVMLPQTDLEGGTRLAERLRAGIATTPVLFGDEEIWVTASLGVATGPFDGMGELELIQAADTALYGSKRAGKNRVTPAPARRTPNR